MTIRRTKRVIATKSQHLRKYFSEEIYNLETGGHYSSPFHRDASHIGQFLRQRWKPLAFATVCLILMTMAPAVIVACRRRLGKEVLCKKCLTPCNEHHCDPKPDKDG